jgi:MFS family permease
MALGPILGGTFIGICGEKDGVRFAFIAALFLAAVALVIQHRLIEEATPRRDDERDGTLKGLASKIFRRMDPALKNLLVSDILVRFCEQIPYAFVVIWCMKVILSPVTAVQFGLLTAIEMITAMLIYIPIAHLADRSRKKPLVVITFGFFSLFPLFLFWSQSFAALSVAFIVRGLKEFGEPTRKALILDLAPEDLRASTFGFYYLIRDLFVSFTAFGGAFLWQVSRPPISSRPSPSGWREEPGLPFEVKICRGFSRHPELGLFHSRRHFCVGFPILEFGF